MNVHLGLVTPLYAAILALFQVYLSWRVVSLRNKYQIRMGDGGHTELTGAVRVHGNLLEYLPTAIILLLLLEVQGFNSGIIHVLGLLLLFARLLHVKGIHDPAGASRSRKIGTRMTWAQMTIAALLCFCGYIGIVF